MEERAARPEPSGVRPPSDPPGRLALGGSDEPEDEHDRELRELYESLVQIREGTARLAVQQAFGDGSFEHAQGLESAFATLDALAGGAHPETLDTILDELMKHRAYLADQLALERLVQRPIPKHNKVMRPEDDRPRALKATIRMVDSIIDMIRRAKGTN